MTLCLLLNNGELTITRLMCTSYLCAAAMGHRQIAWLGTAATPHYFGHSSHVVVKAEGGTVDMRLCRRREVRYATQADLGQTLQYKPPHQPYRFLGKSTI
jgi:hypothetical protein